MNKPHNAALMAISSEVGVGAVGLSIARYVFAGAGLSAICLPTVFYPVRPGLGRGQPYSWVTKAADLQTSFTRLGEGGLLAGVGGVLTGYFADIDQIRVTRDFLADFRQKRPELTIIVDPIIGDFGTGLYVPSKVAAALKDELLPLADVITPNLFEFLWLTGQAPLADEAPFGAVRPHDEWAALFTRLPATLGHAVITSSRICKTETGREGAYIETILVGRGKHETFQSRYFEDVPNGTGDIFAATLLCALISGGSLRAGVRHAVDRLERVADKAQGASTIEPYLLL